MIVVTGATGFIGRALCRDLVARGIGTAGTYRGDRRELVPPGVDPRPVGDLTSEDPWRGAVSSGDSVVHLAGIAHVVDQGAPGRKADSARLANAEATRALYEAAVRDGARRLIFVSTAKVHGETSNRPWTEDSVPTPSDPYSASKWLAEETLAKVAPTSPLEVVVLRPPLVYGPEVKANFLALLRLCDSPWPLPLASFERNRRSLLYIGNLIDAIRCVVEHASAPGHTFLVGDEGAWSTSEIVRKIRAALGRPSRLFPVPPAVARGAAALVGRSSAADRLLGSFELDTGRIRRELKWRPPFSLEHGLAATAAWYRSTRG